MSRPTQPAAPDIDPVGLDTLGRGRPPGSTTEERPACRDGPHHRLKTHGGWTHRMLEPGYYLWRSPTGRRYLRTPTGTVALT